MQAKLTRRITKLAENTAAFYRNSSPRNRDLGTSMCYHYQDAVDMVAAEDWDGLDRMIADLIKNKARTTTGRAARYAGTELRALVDEARREEARA